MALLSRDITVAPYRVLAALELIVATLFGALALELLFLFLLELVRARQEHRQAVDLIGNNLLVGVVLLVLATLFALGARSLARRWPQRWLLQGVLAVGFGGVVWFLLAG